MFTVIAGGSAISAPVDPPVPHGRDPGGLLVAFICSGIDYTDSNISQMFARDGEGEITGYDFIDDDRRPYAASGETRIAEVLIGEGQATTLIALRASATDAISLAKAIGYAAKSPATIIAIALPLSATEPQAIVQAASARFPQHLFILAATEPPLPELPNVLVVSSAALSAAAGQAPTADVAVNIDGATAGEPAHMIAVARTAALAGRRQAVEPSEDGAALKQSILKLAEPLPANIPANTRSGWISGPRRHFWLE